MATVSVAEAKMQLSALLDRVERGEEVVITRRGRSVARLSAVERRLKPIDFDAIEALREATPLQTEPAERFIRRLRDDARY
ncbi:MAG: type II toxin-antitoxin system prevent-host-death family antitoxin [Geminicoccaceae bacterium]